MNLTSKHDAGRQAESLTSRVYSKCRFTIEGCWLWQGWTDRNGYGSLTVGSRRDGTRRSAWVHRVMYEQLVGPIPDGMTLDHLCNRPACCNPAHLRVATLRDNILRGPNTASAVNARKENCPKCGGPYSSRSGGKRICRPCRAAYLRRQRQRTGPGRARGVRHAGAKLTEAQVLELRELGKQIRPQRGRSKDELSWAELGRRFGISDVQARDVALERSWMHV